MQSHDEHSLEILNSYKRNSFVCLGKARAFIRAYLKHSIASDLSSLFSSIPPCFYTRVHSLRIIFSFEIFQSDDLQVKTSRGARI